MKILINGSEVDVGRIRSLVLQKANELKTNAAYSGSWDDGGAHEMIDKFDIWYAGLEQRPYSGILNIAKELARQSKIAEAEKTSEYQKYLELKAKFKDLEK